jgi:hypothetical protein
MGSHPLGFFIIEKVNPLILLMQKLETDIPLPI